MHPLPSPGTSRPASLPGRQTSVEAHLLRIIMHISYIACTCPCTISYSIFWCKLFAIKQTLIFTSNKLPSVSCHCYIERQTFVYTLRHSQVFHVLATWGVETCYTILHNATWGIETERSRAEKSQAVSAVTAMTGGG